MQVEDINLPVIDWEQHSNRSKTGSFLGACEEASLEQLVTFPTQVRGNTLDLVLTNIQQYLC
jgi:hypothetical protein